MTLQFRQFANYDLPLHLRQQPFEVPCHLGPWKLLECAGEGALSRVYRGQRWYGKNKAEGSHLDCVAIKVLRARWQKRADALQMFLREATVAEQVSHPNLISLVESRLHEEPHYLVMPWVEGTRLDRQLAKSPLGVAAGISILQQIAGGLSALHEAGWIHADLKPENVLVAGGRATLIDLGFAQQVDELNRDAKQPLFGTINYIAPERLETPPRTGISSDLYSFGIMAYELLSGRLPFAGQSCGEVAQQHRTVAPASLLEVAPQVPRPLAELVDQLLAKDPAERPASAAAVQQQLQSLATARRSA